MEVGCWSFVETSQHFENPVLYAPMNETESAPVPFTGAYDNNVPLNGDYTHDTIWNSNHGRIVKQEIDPHDPLLHTCDSEHVQNQLGKIESFDMLDATRCGGNVQLPLLSPDDCGDSLMFRLGSTSTDNNEAGYELYHDLIMQHLVKDIKFTSNRLTIPSDPRVWSIEDTQRWLLNVSNQYQLNDMPLGQLGVPGHILCSMGLEPIKQIFPQGGELLHAQLNVWVTANDYEQRHQTFQSPFCSKFARDSTVISYTSLPTSQPISTQQSPKSLAKKCRGANMRISITSATTHMEQPCLQSPNSDSGISTDYEDLGACETPNTLESLKMHMFKSNIHLWQFLRELLDNEKYAHCIRWLDRAEGIFKIEDSIKLSKMWGYRKHRPAMNYDKLSRSLRQYYRKGILKKTSRSQRLVYQFLPPYHTC